ALHQKEALGVLGVNMLYGAFYQRETPSGLIASLSDDLSRERVEIDMIRFAGPAFAGIDNRLMALQLVERGLTDAAMFTATGDVVGHLDFLARADILGALGLDVLISRFEPYYQVAEYLARYTERPIGIAVGLPSVRQIADEKYYADLPGGVLESAGRLFKRSVKMYVYPTRDPASRQIQ